MLMEFLPYRSVTKLEMLNLEYHPYLNCTPLNPKIVESDGEWVFEEACLSIPGLSWEIIRPKTIHLVGIDLDGNEVSIEADELEARLFQHEIDHLNGVLLLDLLDDESRRQALSKLRELDLRRTPRPPSDPGELRLP